jgi:hypothetical protein
MIDDSHKLEKGKFNVREADVVGNTSRKTLEPVNEVVPEVPNGTAEEWWESKGTRQCHALDEIAQG